MNTPPGQTVTPRMPITPRHGANFRRDESPVRRKSSRLNKEQTNIVTATYTHTSSSTLSPPPSSPLGGTPSPRRSPRNVKRATFALSEEDERKGEEEADGGSEEEEKWSSRRLRKHSAPTTTTDIGLPTPSKTPRKRKVPPAALKSSAKVLFPDTPARSSTSSRTTTTTTTKMVEPPKTPVRQKAPPKTPRKTRAFSIDRKSTTIEIYTDTRERIPQPDLDSDNPFLSRPSDETRASKRRRQQIADRVHDKLGPDAGREDGMYYTFRGKRIFRSFKSLPDAGSRADDDDDEEDEEEEEEEEGGLNPASIKPRLLFPDASPSKSPVPHHHRNNLHTSNLDLLESDDEEAETDIDETASIAAQSTSSIIITSKPRVPAATEKSSPVKKRKTLPPVSASRMTTPDDEDDGEIIVKQPTVPATPKKGQGKRKRVSGAAALFDDEEDGSFVDNLVARWSDEEEETRNAGKSVKKNSPRGQKRGTMDIGLDTPPQTGRKRLRRTFA
ncbi:hypothetical protein EX30DRAFT_262454 [Ascodesmis nigricans]|uniref:Uncharacterized protein n=1 Tax=Ascodesmis nigricans TaxID=341454 RepID=A0A4S2MXP1_9PEZI|nr:hypothetical protein EX30DRAFT_262454 [Ascodesmis nigricans]